MSVQPTEYYDEKIEEEEKAGQVCMVRTAWSLHVHVVVHVCVHVHIYIYMYIHVHTCTHIYIYIYMYIHVHTYTCRYTLRPCKLNIRFLVQTQMKRRQGTRLFILFFGGGGAGGEGGEGGEAG